ncbi:MAG: translation initiation factor IF-3 [Chitinivibrionales bacterium]|nr:translation initiation factor IF-3 [Chitinivibrionales bacterium]
MQKRKFFAKKEDETRINHRVRASQVRLISESGEQVGVVPTSQALQRALDVELDLVEIAPNANPPVCKIMDYGKFKYEKSKKAKEAKKKQHVVHLKEIKLHPKTDDHDFNFKKDHARKFLMRGDRVKVTVVFRGREITHKEFGQRILTSMTEDLDDIAIVEQNAKMEGRNMVSIFVPDKAKIKDLKRKMEQDAKRKKEAEPEQ